MRRATLTQEVIQILFMLAVATLVVVAYLVATRIIEVRQRSEWLSKSNESDRRFLAQRIRLYEIALASKPDNEVYQKAETAFAGYQQKKGMLQVIDSSVTQIVSIPEVRILEHRPYSWRVFVAEDRNVQLVVARFEDSKDMVITPSDELFVQPLPAGESVVQMIWKDGNAQRLRSQGILEVPDDAGLKVIVGSSEFHCDEPAIVRTHPARTDGTLFETTTRLFEHSSQVRLGSVTEDFGVMEVRGMQVWLRQLSKEDKSP